MADEYEAKAKAYRAVANDMMKYQPVSDQPKRKKISTPAPTRNYNGKHWMQNPINRTKMMKQIRKMQKAKKALKG